MTTDAPAKRLRLEALVAYPPTSRCREILALLKALVAEFPDQIRLDVYYAGESPSATPTRGYQNLDKRKTIPSGFLNGRIVFEGTAPVLEEFRKEVEAELRREPSAWED